LFTPKMKLCHAMSSDMKRHQLEKKSYHCRVTPFCCYICVNTPKMYVHTKWPNVSYEQN
jgi:hypothetical protein